MSSPDEKERKKAYTSDIPIRMDQTPADSDGLAALQAHDLERYVDMKLIKHDPGDHQGAHLSRPRVAWEIEKGRETSKALANVAAAEKRHARTPTEHRLEFRITSIQPAVKNGKEVNKGKTSCDRQPNYPFKEPLSDKARRRDEAWFSRVVFHPTEEAFPDNKNDPRCRCKEHLYEATVEVRPVGSETNMHPGWEIDPHVIFHDDDDGDQHP